MTESMSFAPPAVVGDTAYFRTATGTRVHLAHCPSLHERDAFKASAAARLALGVCAWCTDQLNGHGREYFDSLEELMTRVGVPVEAQPIVREALRFVRHDELFTVYSLSYGALGYSGRTVASFGKTYYWVGDRRVNLPDYVEVSGTGHAARKEYGRICPVHFVATALNGVCDDC
ncbi:MAG: hypothetical protein ACT4QG_12615 [Sporichthyaceae bacterium]